jgi:kynurenine formamidase
MNATSKACVTLVLACASWAANGQQTSPKDSLKPGQHSVNEEQVKQWMSTLNNWGRWGKNDELGTLNLITPAKRRQAATLVKAGISVSAEHDLMTVKDPIAKVNQRPFVLKMAPSLSADTLEINSHDMGLSHMDTPCHMGYNGTYYNGWSQKDVVNQQDGCLKFGIQNLKDGFVTRGILVDMPRLRGVAYLEPGSRVYREDLEAWEKKTGLKIGPGDAVFLRTGRWTMRAKGLIDKPVIGETLRSGFDASVIPFIKERDIALIAGDECVLEHQGPYTKSLPFIMQFPIHQFLIAGLGMYLIDSADFDAVAATASKLNRWEFMLSVAPIRITNGTGSLVNPLAVF